MKKIYCVTIDGDGGELWLDAELKYLEFIHCNDGQFRQEYYGWLFGALGAECVFLFVSPTDAQQTEIEESGYDAEDTLKILEKSIREEIQKLNKKSKKKKA